MGPVAFAAVAFNIPKFLETEIVETENSTQIHIAKGRIEPNYMLYYTFSLIAHPTLTTGIAPLGALFFMNYKIFQGTVTKTSRSQGLIKVPFKGKARGQ